jgi:hypothetical protein
LESESLESPIWLAVFFGKKGSEMGRVMTPGSLHWLAIAVVAFSSGVAACKPTNNDRALGKDVILARHALCVTHDVSVLFGRHPTDAKEYLKWAIGRVREFEHDAGIDIGEDKAEELLRQADKDFWDSRFNDQDCGRYAGDYEVFKREASTNAEPTSH